MVLSYPPGLWQAPPRSITQATVILDSYWLGDQSSLPVRVHPGFILNIPHNFDDDMFVDMNGQVLGIYGNMFSKCTIDCAL